MECLQLQQKPPLSLLIHALLPALDQVLLAQSLHQLLEEIAPNGHAVPGILRITFHSSCLRLMSCILSMQAMSCILSIQAIQPIQALESLQRPFRRPRGHGLGNMCDHHGRFRSFRTPPCATEPQEWGLVITRTELAAGAALLCGWEHSERDLVT